MAERRQLANTQSTRIYFHLLFISLVSMWNFAEANIKRLLAIIIFTHTTTAGALANLHYFITCPGMWWPPRYQRPWRVIKNIQNIRINFAKYQILIAFSPFSHSLHLYLVLRVLRAERQRSKPKLPVNFGPWIDKHSVAFYWSRRFGSVKCTKLCWIAFQCWKHYR